jgi:hypothetical protein
VLTANYFGTLHTPQPHNVKVAIFCSSASNARLAHELSTRSRDGFNVSEVTSAAQVRKLVRERKLASAYEQNLHRTPVLIVATALPLL